MVSLADILAQNKDVLCLLPSNRIKCSVTGHEMPPNVESVTSHLNGKKFKKAQEWYTHDYTQYLPLIIEHRTDKTKLFCTLTRLQLNKIPAEIQKHVNGKKFLRIQSMVKAKADKAQSGKALRQKEREEAEKAGVWIPSDEVLGEDDDSLSDEDARGSTVAMDDGESDDEDWIFTSKKISKIKSMQVEEDEEENEEEDEEEEDDIEPQPKPVASKAKPKGSLRKGVNDHGKRISKPVSRSEFQREEVTKKKKRS